MMMYLLRREKRKLGESFTEDKFLQDCSGRDFYRDGLSEADAAEDFKAVLSDCNFISTLKANSILRWFTKDLRDLSETEKREVFERVRGATREGGVSSVSHLEPERKREGPSDPAATEKRLTEQYEAFLARRRGDASLTDLSRLPCHRDGDTLLFGEGLKLPPPSLVCLSDKHFWKIRFQTGTAETPQGSTPWSWWTQDPRKSPDDVRLTRHPPAQFPPATAAGIYSLLQAKGVFDPYAGWGDRCVAALARGVSYFGVDRNADLVPAYESLLSEFAGEAGAPVRVLLGEPVESVLGRLGTRGGEGGSESATQNHVSARDSRDGGDGLTSPSLLSSASLASLLSEVDVVFSSPPWYKEVPHKGQGLMLQEKYASCETDYNRFLQTSLAPVAKHFLEGHVPSVRWIALYINEEMATHLGELVGCRHTQTIHIHLSSKVSGTVYCWKVAPSPSSLPSLSGLGSVQSIERGTDSKRSLSSVVEGGPGEADTDTGTGPSRRKSRKTATLIMGELSMQ
uniref:Uncharacterized protein n=1 Tax=Chromera velia CCMP2878 TaxID=1169474 RepID=A0A0G4HFA4_9ALVE|eukprot:Cvel_26983.t1-p1 / transcript=Cvel_26983.t1 / gene=Cvel_26983 / organism=Chromera_velia_CCMP2878 / gene_product=hypothetical protein / transcript_product=hypothetical protein / location=Cvel_scaffold3295:3601-5133(-) / protein_length=511 / sequence_SO=supercontig / SO=protein_coding / is_pseudo=false